ncbi:MAG: dephospho-CoA kinase [Armatimonadetes bacterium]|nr:dephospho-CoA kinase [Armatimonadota bacterium]
MRQDAIRNMVIGVTGGLATGKSTVSAMFGDLGANVLSADSIAREVLAPNSPMVGQVAEAFGFQLIRADGTLDREQLARIIFSDSDARYRLNKMMHPPILERLRRQIEESLADNPDRHVVVEVPLLFELGMGNWFDKIVVVTCSERAEIARLFWRDGLNELEARMRIATQLPLAEKVRRADFVVHNEGARSAVASHVGRIWMKLNELRLGGNADSSECLLNESKSSTEIPIIKARRGYRRKK